MPVGDLGTLRNYAAQCIRGLVATIGFVNGCGYDVEVSQVFDPTTGAWTNFGVREDSLVGRYPAVDNAMVRVLAAFRVDSGHYMLSCLSDICDAMRRPDGTAFYCYRAIETLQQYFIKVFNIENDKDAWETLRTRLGVDRKRINAVKEFADPRRHGGARAMTYEDRKTILATTCDVVDRFVKFVHDHPELERATDD